MRRLSVKVPSMSGRNLLPIIYIPNLATGGKDRIDNNIFPKGISYHPTKGFRKYNTKTGLTEAWWSQKVPESDYQRVTNEKRKAKRKNITVH